MITDINVDILIADLSAIETSSQKPSICVAESEVDLDF